MAGRGLRVSTAAAAGEPRAFGRSLVRRMNRKTKVAAAAGLILIAAARYLAVRHHHDDEIRRQTHVRAQRFKDEVGRAFAAGASQPDVIHFLRDRRLGFYSEGWDEVYLSVGQEPSDVWYCGPMEVGVGVTFKRQRLVQTVVSTWGLNCL